MRGPVKRGRYHHGDLRSALIEVAVELIAERGIRGFSMAEASRRLGVAASAPYAHFADRDALLAAVAVHAYQVVNAEFLSGVDDSQPPARRLAAIAQAYVRFAGTNRPLFDVLQGAGLDKNRYPEVMVAAKPLTDAFFDSVRGLAAENDVEALAGAVEATAHGHAMLLFGGEYGPGDDGIAIAAERAARATLALVEGRHVLSRPSGLPPA